METRARTDCFGYSRDYIGRSGCAALKEMICLTRGQCPFYKSRDLVKAEAAQAFAVAYAVGYYRRDGKYEPKGERDDKQGIE